METDILVVNQEGRGSTFIFTWKLRLVVKSDFISTLRENLLIDCLLLINNNMH